MRRLLVLLLCLPLSAGGAFAAEGEPTVTMRTPAMVQMTNWCQRGDPACAQRAADTAQAHCAKHQRNAELSESDLIERNLSGGEKFGYRFKCVR